MRATPLRPLAYIAADVTANLVMTLRDRQREHYYRQLDRLFPGLSDRYRAAFGERYSAAVQWAGQLETLFGELAGSYGLARAVKPYAAAEARQMALFHAPQWPQGIALSQSGSPWIVDPSAF